MTPISGSSNAAFIAAQAEALATRSAIEDEKSSAAAKNADFDASIEGTKKAARTRRNAAKEKVEAAKKGIRGLAAGLGVSVGAAIAIIVAAAVAYAVLSTISGGTLAALIGVALAVAVAGGMGGGAAGDAAGKKNHDRAAKAEHEASTLDTAASEREQDVDDWTDLEQLAGENFEQALDDRRSRDEYRFQHGAHKDIEA